MEATNNKIAKCAFSGNDTFLTADNTLLADYTPFFTANYTSLLATNNASIIRTTICS